ncbi:MAG: S-methyl-5-thioribose-1-phosphate isomerase [Verrucomicrobia bacterium]|nr:S-methyl-5-thioribose-1-phosphate isomerase [Verrucomicrobiota bacterium]
MNVRGKTYRAVWMPGRDVVVIDQRLLPHRFKLLRLRNHRETAEAIRNMTIRGAGTIGATAAYGMAQAFLEGVSLPKAYETLVTTRPTAVDLKHALDRVLVEAHDAKTAVAVAERIADEYVARMKRIAEIGCPLIPKNGRVLTHCNAGWLAIVDWGSATAPIYAAHRKRRGVFVWVDETRPRCQGAHLTSWELLNEGVPHKVIADNAAGYFMRHGDVDLCIVGADRIAANGDTANKLGTYEKAVLAKENGIPFYIAAPSSTIDPHCPNGDSIPIEERSEDEVHFVGETRVTPRGARAANPAFDVTPAKYITGIITERGIHKPGEVRKLWRQ